jgi:hypothetical protein
MGALAFALLGLMGASAYRALVPDPVQWGSFTPICVLLGAICGWKVMGPRAGRGWRQAMGAGLSTSAVLVVVALFLFSGNDMVQRSLRGRYDGPMDATVATFGLMVEHGAVMLDAGFIGLMLVGGVVGGLLAELGQRRWR